MVRWEGTMSVFPPTIIRGYSEEFSPDKFLVFTFCLSVFLDVGYMGTGGLVGLRV